jgi:hypothetical protein
VALGGLGGEKRLSPLDDDGGANFGEALQKVVETWREVG